MAVSTTSDTTTTPATTGEPGRKPKLPPLPAGRSKYPVPTATNVVVQQILQAAVAGPPSGGPPTQSSGDEEKEEESQYEEVDLHSPARSSLSSEEGEGVYVLFNEDDSVVEDIDECELCVYSCIEEVCPVLQRCGLY